MTLMTSRAREEAGLLHPDVPSRTPMITDTHTRSRRGPAVHPPDPSLSYPIPQHVDVVFSARSVTVSH